MEWDFEVPGQCWRREGSETNQTKHIRGTLVT